MLLIRQRDREMITESDKVLIKEAIDMLKESLECPDKARGLLDSAVRSLEFVSNGIMLRSIDRTLER